MFKGNKKNESLSAFIGKGITIEGNLRFSGILRLDGKVKGQVESDGTLSTGVNAIIEGNVTVTNLMLSGTINGKVLALKELNLSSTAKINGDINYGSLVIESGAEHEGNSHKLTEDEKNIVTQKISELLDSNNKSPKIEPASSLALISNEKEN